MCCETGFGMLDPLPPQQGVMYRNSPKEVLLIILRLLIACLTQKGQQRRRGRSARSRGGFYTEDWGMGSRNTLFLISYALAAGGNFA
jgi:hypothetical protein